MKTDSKPTLADELRAYRKAAKAVIGASLDAVIDAVDDWAGCNTTAIRRTARRRAFRLALDAATKAIPKAAHQRAYKAALDRCIGLKSTLPWETDPLPHNTAFHKVYDDVYFKAYKAAYEETKAKFPAYKTGRYPDKA